MRADFKLLKKVYANKLNILWELFLSYLTVSQYIDEDYL